MDSNNKFNLNKEKCLRCGACVSVCPLQALELDESGIIWDEEKCNFCKICKKICPAQVIEIGD